MKTIKTTVLLTLIASTFLLFSCAKDGKDGLPGPAGANGNANVKSQTFTTNSGSWTHIGTQGQATDGYMAIYTTSIITNDIVNNGAVSVYYFENPFWVALPVSFTQPTWTEHWGFTHRLGEIRILREDSDFYTSNPGTRTFKVVAIASSARIANPNMDYTNYEEVKATFNLED